MTTKSTAAGIIAAAMALSQARAASPSVDLPIPKNLGDPAKVGVGIQRTMTLLATSTSQHRNTVRILFYGQSITEQAWWHIVADDLRQRFPNANLVIENRALGGFASDMLVKTAETDLYSFYPDLMIFHVYGSHPQYEDIIHRTRARTTAEVLIQTDHITRDADLDEETDPAKLRPDGKIWNSFMNYLWLPTVASRYGAAIEDQRNLWKQYLRDTGLPAKQFLQDGVHPNAQGSWLMAQFANAYLVKRDDVTIDPMNCDTVRTFIVGKDARWRRGQLKLAFDGNRVDVILKPTSAQPAASSEPAKAAVLIDGRPPSENPDLYGFTRALSQPGGKWPVILKMAYSKPLQVEDWTLQVTQEPAHPKVYQFRLAGSKTGPDGSGASDQPFVSRSGRIAIDPKDWNVEYSLALPGIKPVPDALTVHWSVVPHFLDEFACAALADPTLETAITVAQGLKNGLHTLELSCKDPASIAAIRVYRPPVKEGPPSQGKIE